MSTQRIDPFKGLSPMKTIKLDSKSAAKAYLTRSPCDTHTKEEMDSLLRAIRFTKMFRQQESLDKMDEEEIIQRPVFLSKYGKKTK